MELIDEKVKTDLAYKEHGDFFEDYHLIRKRAFVLLAEAITDKNKVKELYKTIITLVDFTSNYMYDISEVDELLLEIDKLMAKNRYVEAISEMRQVLRKINTKHEASAILPQKSMNFDEKEKFWRDEESKGMKEMKKAFFDVFMRK